MKGRWVGTILTATGFDAVSGTVSAATATDLQTKLAADKADAKTLANTGLTDWVEKMASSLDRFLKERTQIADERVLFQRFNNDFLAPDVITALNSVGGDFRPADLKAMLAKESGDFTNTAIAGLETKTTGVTTKIVNKNKSFVGIAQMSDAAHTDALKAATTLGVVGPAKSTTADPRKDPAQAIEIAALYIAYIAERLRAKLPATQPTGAEWKKFVLAGYNGGVQNVVAAVTSHGTQKYTWADIAGDDTAMATFLKPDEVRSFVTRIGARAP
jgi:hypothetical protein